MNESVDYELKKDGDLAVFKLNESRFDATTAGFVKGEFTILLSTEGINKLVVDLSEVEYCDSSGLSAILLAYRLLQANEGYIRLAGLQKSVKNLIEISQLSRILPVSETAEEAVAELKKL
jgi:anti-sigma B factor antagonist